MDITQISPDGVIVWRWGPLLLNATVVFTWLVMTLLTVGAWLVTRTLSSAAQPSRWQNVLEVLVVGMQQHIRDISHQEPTPYLPFVGTLFVFIAMANLLTIIPGYLPPTGSLFTTAALALCVLLAVPMQQEQAAFLHELRQRASQQLAAIARRALADLAHADLEQQMLTVFVAQLRTLNAAVWDSMTAAPQDTTQPLVIRSAFALPPAARQQLQCVLREHLGEATGLRFETMPAVMCGIEMQSNGQKIAWNLEHYVATLEEHLAAAFQRRRVRTWWQRHWPRATTQPQRITMTRTPETLQALLDETFSIVERVVEQYRPTLQPQGIGTVHALGHGIARVHGLPGVRAEELVCFPGGLLGLAFNLDATEVGVILLDDSGTLHAGAEVRRTGRVLDVPVGEALLGRIVDTTGRALDDGRPVRTAQRWPVEQDAPAIMDRAPVTVPLQTGLKVVDALIPIGRGQRELILGDRQTGKTAIALDTIINQRDKDVICVYCAIGKRSAAVAGVIADLRQYQAMAYCIVVVSTENDPPGLQFITPYAATTMAEYFMRQGDCLESVWQVAICNLLAKRPYNHSYC